MYQKAQNCVSGVGDVRKRHTSVIRWDISRTNHLNTRAGKTLGLVASYVKQNLGDVDGWWFSLVLGLHGICHLHLPNEGHIIFNFCCFFLFSSLITVIFLHLVYFLSGHFLLRCHLNFFRPSCTIFFILLFFASLFVNYIRDVIDMDISRAICIFWKKYSMWFFGYIFAYPPYRNEKGRTWSAWRLSTCTREGGLLYQAEESAAIQI